MKQNIILKQIMELRALIEQFITERRDKKIEDLKGDKGEKYEKIMRQYERETWLADAAKRASQIQLVTHAIKFTHPSARGTSFYFDSSGHKPDSLIGTHTIAHQLYDDVVGNAAALDVYKFLKLKYQDISLLDRIKNEEEIILKAFSDNIELAQEWCNAFKNIFSIPDKPVTHTFSKQIYFPVNEKNYEYHLLVPLFPTSLVHAVYNKIQEERFGENSKTARQAAKNNKSLPEITSYSEYPDLVTQNFGGSKPQNISQLNSERGGKHSLLPSCPPIWRSKPVRAPLGVNTLFGKWLINRKGMKNKINTLMKFLKINKENNNKYIRNTREILVREIFDEVFQCAKAIHTLEAGWSMDDRCKLDNMEIFWLDPKRETIDEDFAKDRNTIAWEDQISIRLSNWFNYEVLKEKGFNVGDSEYYEWRKEFNGLLEDEMRQFREDLENE